MQDRNENNRTQMLLSRSFAVRATIRAAEEAMRSKD